MLALYGTVRGEGKRNATWRAAAAPRLPLQQARSSRRTTPA